MTPARGAAIRRITPTFRGSVLGASRSLRIVVAVAFLNACVPVPPEMLPRSPGSAPAAGSAFPDVDAGSISISTLHFTVRGYNESEMRAVAALAEDIYNKIGNDTGLYSYLAGQTYALVLYKNQNEYYTKTKQPARVPAIAGGNTIFTYAGPELAPALAHQLAHLVFRIYMADRAGSLLWLDEGLAMYQEVARMSDGDRASFRARQSEKLRLDRKPISQMVFFAGSSEENRREEAWYLQVESVMSFLLKQGTNLNFAAFLNELRNGATLDLAIGGNYAGKFRGVADFETAWQASL